MKPLYLSNEQTTFWESHASLSHLSKIEINKRYQLAFNAANRIGEINELQKINNEEINLRKKGISNFHFIFFVITLIPSILNFLEITNFINLYFYLTLATVYFIGLITAEFKLLFLHNKALSLDTKKAFFERDWFYVGLDNELLNWYFEVVSSNDLYKIEEVKYYLMNFFRRNI